MSFKKELWASQRKVNFLCNFNAVAVACTNIQNVLLRSWAAPSASSAPLARAGLCRSPTM
jgi:hypothetical protein